MIAETEAAAVELRDKAAACAKMAEEFDVETAELRAMLERAEKRAAREKGLSSIPKKGTLGVPKMEAQSASRGAKVSIARTKSTWPFRQALHKRNLSLPEWARSQKGITVEAAKSWLKAPSGGGRPIPLVWAERISKEFLDGDTGKSEVPPVDGSWPNGIR
jgi:hypothetical protein